MKRIILIAAVLSGLAPPDLLAAPRTLDIYWIDADGGAATLIVTPRGESLLVDTAHDREVNRIYSAIQQAGLKKIDVVVSTHYHADHVGAAALLSKMIPIGRFIDHGPTVEQDRPVRVKTYETYAAAANGKRSTAKAGDTVPLKGVDVRVVMASRQAITKPLKGGGPNPLCSDWKDHRPDIDPDNNESVGILLSYGKFDFLDLGDLTWNYEKSLACPMNMIGTVDLFQVTHHGLDRSNSPQLVWAVKPQVMIMNNGPHKGGPPSVFEILRKSPGLEDIWQGHLSLDTPKELNTDEKMIANFEPTPECKGNWIKASVAPNGKYTVTNGRNGFSKTYDSR
jgi:competence protein ComEC